MRLPLRSLVAALAAFLLACKTPAPPPVGPAPEATASDATLGQPAAAKKRDPNGGPIRITVVGTNDIHGWVHSQKFKLPDGQELEEGGLAAFAGYLKILRARNPDGVLLLDAGDLFQGTLASNLTEGEIVIDGFNYLGYTAAALGNHEFDYGPVGPVSVAVESGTDPFGALKARFKQAKFPMLAVNLYETHTGERPAWIPNDGTVMIDVQGVKVGIIGLITPQTPQTTNPVNVATLRFGSLIPEAAAAAQRLREKGAHLVIAVAHAGGKCAKLTDAHDTSSCDLQGGEIFEMLQGLPPKTLDAVVAGHTHAGVGHYVNGTPVIETFGLGRYFGTIDLLVDPKTHQVLADKTEIKPVIPICRRVEATTGGCDSRKLKELPKDKPAKLSAAMFMGEKVEADGKLDAMLAPSLDRVSAEQSRKLGLTVPANIGRNYEGESALGNFLSDSLRKMEGADLAVLNSGGLRADLPAGDLTYGDVYEVLPFDNTVATLTLTGDELKRLLQAAYGAKKGVFQVSGIKVKLARCPGQGRLKSFTLEDGKPVLPERRYKLVVPDFLARGGDGLGPVLSSLPPNRIDLGVRRPLNFREALIAYWQKQNAPVVAPPVGGRISFVDEGKACSEGAALPNH